MDYDSWIERFINHLKAATEIILYSCRVECVGEWQSGGGFLFAGDGCRGALDVCASRFILARSCTASSHLCADFAGPQCLDAFGNCIVMSPNLTRCCGIVFIREKPELHAINGPPTLFEYADAYLTTTGEFEGR